MWPSDSIPRTDQFQLWTYPGFFPGGHILDSGKGVGIIWALQQNYHILYAKSIKFSTVILLGKLVNFSYGPILNVSSGDTYYTQGEGCVPFEICSKITISFTLKAPNLAQGYYLMSWFISAIDPSWILPGGTPFTPRGRGSVFFELFGESAALFGLEAPNSAQW